MRALLFVLLLLSLPAAAQLQFDSSKPAAPLAGPSPGAGVAWLQKTPMTLFDLGMMELTETASKLSTGAATDGLQGAVAEYQEAKKIISIGFYSALDYDAPACIELAQRLRDGLFMHRKDQEQLAREVGSYFISYGPLDPARPRSIGAELMEMIRITVYQQGGICQLPLTSDAAEVTDDPTTKKDTPKPDAKDVAPAKP
jgi:hypothetical protein